MCENAARSCQSGRPAALWPIHQRIRTAPHLSSKLSRRRHTLTGNDKLSALMAPRRRRSQHTAARGTSPQGARGDGVNAEGRETWASPGWYYFWLRDSRILCWRCKKRVFPPVNMGRLLYGSALRQISANGLNYLRNESWHYNYPFSSAWTYRRLVCAPYCEKMIQT